VAQNEDVECIIKPEVVNGEFASVAETSRRRLSLTQALLSSRSAKNFIETAAQGDIHIVHCHWQAKIH
jgi:hypothetical protein